MWTVDKKQYWKNFKKKQINTIIFQVYGLEENIIKVSILAKAINKFNVIIRKFITAFFEEIQKFILRFT